MSDQKPESKFNGPIAGLGLAGAVLGLITAALPFLPKTEPVAPAGPPPPRACSADERSLAERLVLKEARTLIAVCGGGADGVAATFESCTFTPKESEITARARVAWKRTEFFVVTGEESVAYAVALRKGGAETDITEIDRSESLTQRCASRGKPAGTQRPAGN